MNDEELEKNIMNAEHKYESAREEAQLKYLEEKEKKND